MSKLDDIITKHSHDNYGDNEEYIGMDFDTDEVKEDIKALMLDLAETHADENGNINQASFIAEINNL